MIKLEGGEQRAKHIPDVQLGDVERSCHSWISGCNGFSNSNFHISLFVNFLFLVGKLNIFGWHDAVKLGEMWLMYAWSWWLRYLIGEFWSFFSTITIAIIFKITTFLESDRFCIFWIIGMLYNWAPQGKALNVRNCTNTRRTIWKTFYEILSGEKIGCHACAQTQNFNFLGAIYTMTIITTINIVIYNI